MHDVERRLQTSQDEAQNNLQENQRHIGSFGLTPAGDSETSVKTFMQRTTHALAIMLNLTRVFFPACNTKGFFEPIRDAAAEKFGPEDMLAQLLTDLMKFNKYMRDARNCVEHPKKKKKVIVKDYSLTPNNTILPPSIEVIHPDSPQTMINILDYMAQIREQVSDMTELLIVFLCSRHMEAPGPFPIQVIELPEDRRQFIEQRFGYGVYTEDGQVMLTF